VKISGSGKFQLGLSAEKTAISEPDGPEREREAMARSDWREEDAAWQVVAVNKP